LAPACYLGVRDLRKEYAGHGQRTVALGGASFEIERGAFVSIVGPSGCGKSTLLQIMAGLAPASAGEVHFQGRAVSSPPPEIIYLFQQYTRSLFPWKTVESNVAYGVENRGVPPAEARRRAREFIGLVRLQGFERHYPWQLSGGMQQRVAIARALACRPDVLLMDEPFSAVDALTRVGLQELVLRLWRELSLTIVFVTHDIDEAVYMSTRVIALSKAPAVVQMDVAVELPLPREPITTREAPRYLEYRHRLLTQLFADEGLAGGSAASA
jgi:NitT/TauT family transport system ATP-binding protein